MKVLMMSKAQIKTRLERALHREITWAEWRNLEKRGLVDEYVRNPLTYTDEENWREFRDSAGRELDFLRSYREDEIREQAGELEVDFEGGGEQAALTLAFLSRSVSALPRVRVHSRPSIDFAPEIYGRGELVSTRASFRVAA